MDPLAQLSDIHLPEQINNYPVAAGWWVLYALTLVLLVFSVYKIWQQHIKKRAQKRAKTHLQQSQSGQEILTILKWVTMEYFPRKQVASLSGDALQDYLELHLKEKHRQQFKQSSGQLLTKVYQKPLTEQETLQLKSTALFWVTNALPPKKQYSMNNEEA